MLAVDGSLTCHIGSAETLFCEDSALLDSYACHYPLVVGVDHARQLLVCQDVVGHESSNASDDRIDSAHLFSYFVLHLDSHLATIVSASGAYGVVDVVGTAVGAYGERGCYGLVMGTTFSGTSLRLSSFRMCHFCFTILTIYYFTVSLSFNSACHRGSVVSFASSSLLRAAESSASFSLIAALQSPG